MEVYLIPAFTGLGPPYWQPDAKLHFMALVLPTSKNHLVRAS